MFPSVDSLERKGEIEKECDGGESQRVAVQGTGVLFYLCMAYSLPEEGERHGSANVLYAPDGRLLKARAFSTINGNKFYRACSWKARVAGKWC